MNIVKKVVIDIGYFPVVCTLFMQINIDIQKIEKM